MAERLYPQADPDPTTTASFATGNPLAEIHVLLEELDRAPAPSGISPPVISPQVDNQLVQVRLGVAGSLFTALRCRYAATANHSLRVALNCSGWAACMELDRKVRDQIEVAALLHDIGVIGVPDQVLLKPGPLDADETYVFEQSRRMSIEILRTCCAEPTVLEIVENIGAWYDGSRKGSRLAGMHIPLGSRMIAVAEAFDAMTADQVFRRAISQERALRELFGCAGKQFDPELVRQFAEFQSGEPMQFRREAARRWLHSLDPETANAFWEMNTQLSPAPRSEQTRMFETRLLDNMHDAVIFIDAGLRIVHWNHGAERLTGITAASICQRSWAPSLLSLQNEKGDWITDDDCPVHCVLKSGAQSIRRLTITGRSGRPIAVDSHVMPVSTSDGVLAGAVVLLHDASSETSLEQRCQSLHEKATKDPLTQVANRAEFDRVHEMFVNAHNQQQVPCALVICDLDHFKQVNDTFGHQAGDEVIKCLASLLRSACRPGDLVARYGGEEFVLLCADCDNAGAARRADQIRRRFSQVPQPKLEGNTVTASFGVTEVQPGDTPETMLRRADRALLMAKEKGRNRVVQLGVGADEERPRSGLLSRWRREQSRSFVLEQDLVTPLPITVAVEKLCGFVADHRAKILKIDGNNLQLQIEVDRTGQLRRTSDRPVGFSIELTFEEERSDKGNRSAGPSTAVLPTRLHAAVRPLKSRDRREADVAERARQLMVSIRSYLVASEEDRGEGMLRKASRMLTSWRSKRGTGDRD